MGDLITVIAIIGICILLFLAFRKVMLWYWKVDTIVKNQELSNQLLLNSNVLLNEQILLIKSQYTELKTDNRSIL